MGRLAFALTCSLSCLLACADDAPSDGSGGDPSGNGGAGASSSSQVDTGGSGADGGGPQTGGGGEVGVGGQGGACAVLPSGPLTRFESNPLLPNGPEAYDFWKTGPRVVLKEGPSTYRLWYEAVADETYTTVGYATSSDGETWAKQGPVLAPSAAWEGNEVSPNSILFEGGVYALYYHAGGSDLVNRRIGRATSNDGLEWLKDGQPLLDLGPAGDFDDEQVAEPRVFNLGAEYRMYYTGHNESTQETALGMASSPDGISWTKYAGNPVLTGAAWGNFWGGAFFYEGGLWHLWHGVTDGSSSSLHYASSSDGIAWTAGPANPVLTQNPDKQAADFGLVGDSVSGFRDGDSYRILYTGFNWNLFGTEGRFEGICMASVADPCP
jgi:Glycosyl hydrolases family 32 N-terminal domain